MSSAGTLTPAPDAREAVEFDELSRDFVLLCIRCKAFYDARHFAYARLVDPTVEAYCPQCKTEPLVIAQRDPTKGGKPGKSGKPVHYKLIGGDPQQGHALEADSTADSLFETLPSETSHLNEKPSARTPDNLTPSTRQKAYPPERWGH